MYEATGKIKLIEDTQTFPSGFTKREFVVTTNGKFPQDLKFEIVKDKCSLLDSFEAGQDVTVHFDIRGNEFKGKYYVNLSCWKLQAGSGEGGEGGKPPAPQRSAPSTSASRPQTEPSAADLRNEDDFDDDIPF